MKNQNILHWKKWNSLDRPTAEYFSSTRPSTCWRTAFIPARRISLRSSEILHACVSGILHHSSHFGKVVPYDEEWPLYRHEESQGQRIEILHACVSGILHHSSPSGFSSFRKLKNRLYTDMKNPKNKQWRFFMPVLVGFFTTLLPSSFFNCSTWRRATLPWRGIPQTRPLFSVKTYERTHRGGGGTVIFRGWGTVTGCDDQSQWISTIR